MKFIDKNKNIIVAVLILVAVIAAIFITKNTIMFDESKAIYGNRTDGIKKVRLSEEQITALKSSLKGQVKDVSVKEEGKIINIIIETKAETDLAGAKEFGNSTLSVFSDEQKSYFDIQVMIKNTANPDQFPIIGYKHKTKDKFTWTRDREKTEG